MAGVKTFKELVAWKLAYELRCNVRPVCQRVYKAKDVDLHKQLREAARSAPRNIAEGFARYKHGDFATFVRIAKASEVELVIHLQEAFADGYLNAQELDSLDHSARKAIKAANGLIRYLDPDSTIE